jgi:hypothetical protein
MHLNGVINKISTDHIGLVTYGMFNVSIPQHRFGKTSVEAQVIRDAVGSGDIRVGKVMRFLVDEVIQANDVVSVLGSLVGHKESGLGIVESVEYKGEYLEEIEKFRNAMGSEDGKKNMVELKEDTVKIDAKKSPYLNEQPQRLMVDTAPSISTEVLPLVDGTSEDEDDDEEVKRSEKKEKKEKKSSKRKREDEELQAESNAAAKDVEQDEKKKKKKKEKD